MFRIWVEGEFLSPKDIFRMQFSKVSWSSSFLQYYYNIAATSSEFIIGLSNAVLVLLVLVVVDSKKALSCR